MATEEETEEQRAARLTQFVLNVCDRVVFTSAQILEPEMVCMVFMPLMLGAKVPEDVGCIWEYMKDAVPRSINGYPSFFSCHFMNKEDWARAHKAIVSELARRKEIKV
jgi:hypothetical protein